MLFLKNLLPRAGMIYPPGGDLLPRSQRDLRVLIALRQAGIVKTDGVTKTINKRAVDKALADFFALAAQPYALLHVFFEDMDLPAMTQSTGAWVRHIGQCVFLKLIQRLIDARTAWHENPREPFDMDQHSATAQMIDLFVSSAKGQERAAVLGLFDIIGDHNVDKEDEKDGQEENGEQSGEAQATTSSNSDQPTGGMDVTMTDLEVELQEDHE
ncbi:hypothetical protein K449DRAFT_146044 [Hypoxylon sp. EC38]|nr:hypothetical protein K449DRAFT_146044 [Hypoxylon sp. EC38]